MLILHDLFACCLGFFLGFVTICPGLQNDCSDLHDSLLIDLLLQLTLMLLPLVLLSFATLFFGPFERF